MTKVAHCPTERLLTIDRTPEIEEFEARATATLRELEAVGLFGPRFMARGTGSLPLNWQRSCSLGAKVDDLDFGVPLQVFQAPLLLWLLVRQGFSVLRVFARPDHRGFEISLMSPTSIQVDLFTMTESDDGRYVHLYTWKPDGACTGLAEPGQPDVSGLGEALRTPGVTEAELNAEFQRLVEPWTCVKHGRGFRVGWLAEEAVVERAMLANVTVLFPRHRVAWLERQFGPAWTAPAAKWHWIWSNFNLEFPDRTVGGPGTKQPKPFFTWDSLIRHGPEPLSAECVAERAATRAALVSP
jgi:hypothetical protein